LNINLEKSSNWRNEMNNFTYHNPTKILFGKDTTDRLAEEMKDRGENILFVYGGGSIKKNGLYDRVMRQLKGKKVYELAGVDPNPRLTTVRQGIKICREKQIDFILAVGGGSAIDCAKAISIGALYEGDVWDFYKGKAQPAAAIPVGAILTLAATGTEMNGNSVITNMETKEKIGFSGILLLHPVFSILDPCNTYTVPNHQLANGCVDMLSHLYECYFSFPDDTPIQDGLAETIMRTVFDQVFVALEKPDDYDARANLMWCGTLALNDIIPLGKDGDWGCHAIEHVLSAHYDIPHGAGLAIITPPYMKYLCRFNPAKYKQYAVNVLGIDPDGRSDYEVGLEGIAKTKSLFKKMGAPVSLSEVGIGTEKLGLMANQVVQDGKIGNYSKIGAEELLQILKDAL
jgi:alcohol dehydrogenase YqhD (iron-dependent ADH family)